MSEMRTPTIEEELARTPQKKEGVPTGLLEPEKKIDESQMADFSTPIDEIMEDPAMMSMQSQPQQQQPQQQQAKKTKNPFGLTDEQFQAALAGVAAIVAFSKPVQGRLGSMVPSFMNEAGEASMTGLAVTALVAAILFFFAKKFLMDRT